LYGMEKKITTIARDVFYKLGPGHSETVYGRAIGVGLQKNGILYECEKTMPVTYLDVQVGTCRLDLVVDGIVVELKCVASVTAAHRLQLKRYLANLDLKRGMLVNFGPANVQVEVLVHEQVAGGGGGGVGGGGVGDGGVGDWF